MDARPSGASRLSARCRTTARTRGDAGFGTDGAPRLGQRAGQRRNSGTTVTGPPTPSHTAWGSSGVRMYIPCTGPPGSGISLRPRAAPSPRGAAHSSWLPGARMTLQVRGPSVTGPTRAGLSATAPRCRPKPPPSPPPYGVEPEVAALVHLEFGAADRVRASCLRLVERHLGVVAGEGDDGAAQRGAWNVPVRLHRLVAAPVVLPARVLDRQHRDRP